MSNFLNKDPDKYLMIMVIIGATTMFIILMEIINALL